MVLPDTPVPTNATYYVVAATQQPGPVLLSPADVTSPHMVDIEGHDDIQSANFGTLHNAAGNGTSNHNTGSVSGFAYGGTVTATPITAYPVKT